jgi:type II secretion system protein L
LFARWSSSADPAIARVRLFGGDAPSWAGRVGGAQIVSDDAGELAEALAVAAAARAAFAPNLRQGAFAPARRGASPWRIWRLAAGLALLAVMLQAAIVTMQGVRARGAAHATLAAAEQEFRTLRPDVRRVVNLRAQVGALTNALRQASDHPVLSASTPLIEVLQSVQGARLEEMRHEAPGRRVRLRLSATQPAQIEAVIAGLKQRGLSVETREMAAVEGRYSVEMTLDSP